jgi:uncharacterized protein YbaR (Trm112 family)
VPASLSAALLAVLACPHDKGALRFFESERCLYNPRLRKKYLIENGVPQLLLQSAIAVDDEEHARLMAIGP